MTEFEAVEKFIEEARSGKATKEETIYRIKNVYYHSMGYPKSLIEIAIEKVEKIDEREAYKQYLMRSFSFSKEEAEIQATLVYNCRKL